MKKNVLLKENFTSNNLFEKFNLLSEEEVNRITLGIDWINKRIPNSIIIGGTALIHYLPSSRDLTPDLDIMVLNLDFSKNALIKDNIEFRTITSGNNPNLGITVPKFNTDLLDSSTGNVSINNLILKNYTTGMLNNRQVKFVIPELLTIMKIEIGREKDTNDAFALLSSNVLNKATYLKFVNILKNNLNEYESLISYAEMIK